MYQKILNILIPSNNIQDAAHQIEDLMKKENTPSETTIQTAYGTRNKQRPTSDTNNFETNYASSVIHTILFIIFILVITFFVVMSRK